MLNKNLFTTEQEMKAAREGFGLALRDIGDEDNKVVALCADLTESVQMHLFKEKFASRFVEVGITEQNMAAMASGMAAMGTMPFIASYAMFNPGRNWEQIRTTIAYNNQKVVIVGAHAGLSVGPDGGTHQAVEDIALMRVMPNMTVLSPCDAREAYLMTRLAHDIDGPVYIRLAREKSPVIFSDEYKKIDTKSPVVVFASPEPHAKKVCIFVTGPIIYEALLAARELEKKDIQVAVVNISVIKPLPDEAIVRFASQYKNIITLEEHQKAGGMGSAVCELLADRHPTKVIRMGIDNRFGQSGVSAELYKEYGISKDDIIKTCLENI